MAHRTDGKALPLLPFQEFDLHHYHRLMTSFAGRMKEGLMMQFYLMEQLGNHGYIARQGHSKDARSYRSAGWTPRLWSDSHASLAFPDRTEWRNKLERIKLALLNLAGSRVAPAQR